MRRVLLFLILLSVSQLVNGQNVNLTFDSPSVTGAGGIDLCSIKQTTSGITAVFKTRDLTIKNRNGSINASSPTFYVSSLIYLVPGRFPSNFKCGTIPWRTDEGGIRSSLSRYKVTGVNGINLNSAYYLNGVSFELNFPPIIGYGEYEYTLFELVEIVHYGDCIGYQIGRSWSFTVEIDYPDVLNVGMSSSSIRNWISRNDNGVYGVYKGTHNSGNAYSLALIKYDGKDVLVFLGSSKAMLHWKVGDLKAELQPTGKSGLYMAQWNAADKTSLNGIYVKVESGGFRALYPNGSEEFYVKTFPVDERSSNSSEKQEQWSGSGFALNDGYVVTNYHVVNGASSMQVYGINGDFSEGYNARLIAWDKKNDLALIRVDGIDFVSIPYAISTDLALVGDDVFVLGYPMTQFMGEEIKLTNGLISSHSGYQGDISTYQITAPIQPGNSGGPLFDSSGNIIGIINAGIPEADNVGYAIKTLYLKNLVESAVDSDIIPHNNSLSRYPLTRKVQLIKDYVYLVKCSK